jgi:hypothetical protein
MAAAPALEPGDLTKKELHDIVERVRDTLWPRGNPDASWSPDTVDAVAGILNDYHLRPA